MLISLISICLVIFGILTALRWYVRKIWGSVDKSKEISIDGKIVLVTGANAGIGKAVALEFAYRNAHVILACRDLSRANDAVKWIREKTSRGQLVCMQLDLSSLQSVRKFSKDFKEKYDRLDVLVNNAGIMLQLPERGKTAEGFEIHMGVNHLGHFLLTNLLLEPLKNASPSRVVIVSSMAHSWGLFDFDDILSENVNKSKYAFINPMYSNSKLANAFFNKSLAKLLEGTGVTSYACCPGMVATEIGQNPNQKGIKKWILMTFISPIFKYILVKSPIEGAATIMYCALNKDLAKQSGEMYQNCGPWDQKSRAVLNDKDAEKLWNESVRLVGLN